MRLFVAVDLPGELKQFVGARLAEIRHRLPKARWVAAENFHLTLAFLGEVEEKLVEPVREALARLAGKAAPSAARLERAGCFPENGAARVAWIGLAPGAALGELAERVRAALAGTGVSPDTKPFRAHVTAARCDPPWPASARTRWAELAAPILGAPVPVCEVTLFASTLGSRGPTYAALARLPLEGRA